MDLEELRKKIDNTDSEILKLLRKRLEFSLKAGKIKGQVEDLKREKQVLERIEKLSNGVISSDFSLDIYKRIISESKNLQTHNKKIIGFQGEHGAHSELAAMAVGKNLVTMPCAEFNDVFEGVANGQLDLGIVPIENSLGGAIGPVNDLLIESDLKIIGEIDLPINQCLLSLPDTDYREIKVVYSHPQALSQCRGFISRNKLEPKPFYDTAGAAMMLSSERPSATAAIASKLCADIYNLEVLKQNIEDQQPNITRFIIISKNESKDPGKKCSIVFSTPHKAGALFEILRIFSENSINLTRIESRPIPKDPGKFAFLVDFVGSNKEAKIQSMIDKIKNETPMFKFLGCYKEVLI